MLCALILILLQLTSCVSKTQSPPHVHPPHFGGRLACSIACSTCFAPKDCLREASCALRTPTVLIYTSIVNGDSIGIFFEMHLSVSLAIHTYIPARNPSSHASRTGIVCLDVAQTPQSELIPSSLDCEITHMTLFSFSHARAFIPPPPV